MIYSKAGKLAVAMDWPTLLIDLSGRCKKYLIQNLNLNLILS